MKQFIKDWWVVAVCAAVMGTLQGVEAHPASTAAQWLADPKAAADAANTAAKHTAGMGAAAWAGIIGAGMTVLAGLRLVAPLVPGLGPVWAATINGIWNIAQHKDAKLADAAQARVAGAATATADVSRQLRNLSPDTWSKLPEDLRNALEALQRAG